MWPAPPSLVSAWIFDLRCRRRRHAQAGLQPNSKCSNICGKLLGSVSGFPGGRREKGQAQEPPWRLIRVFPEIEGIHVIFPHRKFGWLPKSKAALTRPIGDKGDCTQTRSRRKMSSIEILQQLWFVCGLPALTRRRLLRCFQPIAGCRYAGQISNRMNGV
jgi:hypothetical protein